MFLDLELKAFQTMRLRGVRVFIYPFGLCAHFVDYNPLKDFTLLTLDWMGNNCTYENMLLFITDPAMKTYSSIDLQSHQGTKLFGLKKGYYSIYDVEVSVKDSNNPTERHTCDTRSYSECVDQQTQNIFAEVRQLSL